MFNPKQNLSHDTLPVIPNTIGSITPRKEFEKRKTVLLKFRLFALALFFMACGNDQSVDPGITPFEISLAGSTFTFDPNATGHFTKNPFGALNGDTLVIYDYWALGQQPEYHAAMHRKGDTVVITYIPNPLSTVNDWSPTVETALKFAVDNMPAAIRFRILAVENARAPDSLEAAQGFRNAKHDFSTALFKMTGFGEESASPAVLQETDLLGNWSNEALDTLYECSDDELDDRVVVAAAVNGNTLAPTAEGAVLTLTKE